MKIFSYLSIAVLSIACFVAPSAANPTTKTPDALLKIREGEKVPGDYLEPDAKAYAEISQRYAKAKVIADDLAEKLKADKLAIGDVPKVGPLYLLKAALMRDADFLLLRGEASGQDLLLRVRKIDELIFKVVPKLLALPNMNTKPAGAQLEKAHAAGQKRLPQIEQLIAQQKFVQAEGELNEILDDMTRFAIWFPGGDMTAMFKPFTRSFPQAAEQRKDRAVADLQALIERGPKTAEIQAELTQAATQIGMTGQATLNGQMLSGPAFLKEWQANWPKLQAGMQRTLMAQWTLEQIRDELPKKHQALITAQEQFAKSIPGLLAAIVASDAKRLPAAEAAALYPQYVTAAAGLCAVGARQDLDAAFAPAIAALATKAGMDKDVAAYRAAMEPLLGWKRFLARSQAKALSAKAAPVHDWLTKACAAPANPHTILPQQQPQIGSAQIVTSSVDLVLPAVLPTGPAPTVVVTDIVPVNPAAQRCVARYRQRVFSLLAAPPPAALQAAGSQLELQLLATPEQPPLSLDAATALATARLCVFESAGGTVDQVTIEPLLTRFVTLPAEGGALLPLGPLPPEAVDPSTPGQQKFFLSLRCDIAQPWYQNECFLILP